ncbi:hypothetical protein BDZ97DRAFT_1763642 [Flammula alnicola]|nr:hypothetical protein BDZ97DRAFT_1763642 [Flammula alnicola]
MNATNEKQEDPASNARGRKLRRFAQAKPEGKSKKKVTIARTGSQCSDSSSNSTSSSSSDGFPNTWLAPILIFLDKHLGWIPQNFVWSKVKPAIRCALVTWVSAVLFIIPPVEIKMGQASFLILIAAFLSPPSDPFMSVLEREMIIMTLVCLAWAWACLGIFLANLARSVHDPTVTLAQAVSGQFIEAAPTSIMAIFVFFGSAFILYIRARQGPGPYLAACVFGCICLDISLTNANFFPFPFYLIGRAIAVPLAMHSALALLGSLFIFPSTISALFTTRLAAVLTPMLASLTHHRTLLSTDSLTSPSFTLTLVAMRSETRKTEAALIPLAAAARLLKSDLIYGRFAPHDFRAFQKMSRRLAGRADGLGVYFGLIDPAREKFPGTAAHTPAGTAPGTPHGVLSRATSRATSRAPSPERGDGSTRGDNEGDPALRTSASRPNLQQLSRATTRSQAPTRPSSIAQSPLKLAHSHSHSLTHAHSYLHTHHSHGHHHHHHHILHMSLLSLAKARAKRPELAVGTFESQRYLNLELTRLHDPHEEEYTEGSMELLKQSCDPLLEACQLGLSTTQTWFGTVRDGRMLYFLGIKQEEARKRQEERVKKIKEVREKVMAQLEKFRESERHAVLDPYRPAFEDGPTSPATSQPTSPNMGFTPLPSSDANGFAHGHPDAEGSGDAREKAGKDEPVQEEERESRRDEYVMPPHRYLFNCYVYQYHLIQIASIVVEMLDEILRLEEERTLCRLWTPAERFFQWNPSLVPEGVEHLADDDDPDVIQGLHLDQPGTPSPTATPQSGYNAQKSTGPAFNIDAAMDLGVPHRRDPDALPPRNLFEVVMELIHKFIVALGSGNAIFALKAGMLTVLLCLPFFIKNSATFAYESIRMGYLTLARFRGETTFSLVARIIATFFGGITGMIMWYISCGSGRGNPFGLAAVCFACFPFFFYARLYWSIPPLTNIIFFITAVLVIGFSYQDLHVLVPGTPGFGFSVFWKRFTLVVAGVVAAGIASFLPPSTTIRRYQRNLLSTTMAEMGTVYCAILSFANTKHEPEIQEIISSLIAVRSKLARSATLSTNVIYEFSLRGRWPVERYQKITDLQTALAFSLSHLMSVLEHLEPSWSRAFLRRSRFMDPDFQGDILAVISMISSSLRTGSPLPQITPCPLLDRFMLKYHGLDVIHKDSEEDYGLPRTLSLDTLRNEQYLMFSVGISTAYGIINRLDRLMLAVKEVVGEQYHIHGVGLVPSASHGFNMSAGVGNGTSSGLKGPGVELGERTNTVHFDPLEP